MSALLPDKQTVCMFTASSDRGVWRVMLQADPLVGKFGPET
jgi:hypothetical protein